MGGEAGKEPELQLNAICSLSFQAAVLTVRPRQSLPRRYRLDQGRHSLPAGEMLIAVPFRLLSHPRMRDPAPVLGQQLEGFHHRRWVVTHAGAWKDNGAGCH